MPSPKDTGQIDYTDHFNVDRLHQVVSQIVDHSSVKFLLSTGAATFHWVFGGNTEGLAAVTALVFIDTFTGAYKAYKFGKLSSNGFFRFALKNVVYMVLIATASLVDKTMPIAFASIITITFLAATEGISIMENLRAVGFSVPTTLLERLKIIKGDRKISNEPEPLPISSHH